MKCLLTCEYGGIVKAVLGDTEVRFSTPFSPKVIHNDRSIQYSPPDCKDDELEFEMPEENQIKVGGVVYDLDFSYSEYCFVDGEQTPVRELFSLIYYNDL